MQFHLGEYFRTIQSGRKARRRGDSIAADRWMRHAERQLRLAVLFEDTLDEWARRERAHHEAYLKHQQKEEAARANAIKLAELRAVTEKAAEEREKRLTNP